MPISWKYIEENIGIINWNQKFLKLFHIQIQTLSNQFLNQICQSFSFQYIVHCAIRSVNGSALLHTNPPKHHWCWAPHLPLRFQNQPLLTLALGTLLNLASSPLPLLSADNKLVLRSSSVLFTPLGKSSLAPDISSEYFKTGDFDVLTCAGNNKYHLNFCPMDSNCKKSSILRHIWTLKL